MIINMTNNSMGENCILNIKAEIGNLNNKMYMKMIVNKRYHKYQLVNSTPRM